MTFSALLLTVAALVATGVVLLWANQSRNQPMFVAIAVLLFVAAEFVMGWWALPVVGLVLGLIGEVVGSAREGIHGGDGGTDARGQQERGRREVLVVTTRDVLAVLTRVGRASPRHGRPVRRGTRAGPGRDGMGLTKG